MSTYLFKLTAAAVAVSCLSARPHAQSTVDSTAYRHPYHVNYWSNGAITLASGVVNLIGIAPLANKPEISVDELNNLNRDLIPSFDRWALRQDPSHIKKYNSLGDIALGATFVLPAVLAFDKNTKKDWGQWLMMYLETMTLSSNVYTNSFLGPHFQNKFRPVVYYDNLPYDKRKSSIDRNSFYSGHVAAAAATTFFIAKIFDDYYPELGGKRYLIYAAAAIPPLIDGYFRMMALRHFPSDILAGFGIGAVFGILIPELHLVRFRNKDLALGVSTAGGSAGLALIWRPGQGQQAPLQ